MLLKVLQTKKKLIFVMVKLYSVLNGVGPKQPQGWVTNFAWEGFHCRIMKFKFRTKVSPYMKNY